jgi:hypothetical protein
MCNREGVEEWLDREIGVKVNAQEAFKINKDKMMLPTMQSWEQNKNIMLNNSRLKERNGERKENTKEVKRGGYRGKKVKIGYRRIQNKRGIVYMG